jgi:hypothetical protein
MHDDDAIPIAFDPPDLDLTYEHSHGIGYQWRISIPHRAGRLTGETWL